MQLELIFASPQDAEELAALRVLAMRESLERVGRFHPQRARARFLSGFMPEHTRHILLDGKRAGFIVIKAAGAGLLLDHLYIHPAYQNKGIGTSVLGRLFAEADAQGQEIRVGALKESDSNRFYEKHGFVLVEEAEWDNYYVRRPLAIC